MISSPQNPKIKNIVKLRNRRTRDKQQLMIVEGYRSLSRAMNNDIEAAELYYCREFFMGENEDELIQKYADSGCGVYEVSKIVFEKISYRDRPEGLLALAKYQQKNFSDIPLSENPFLVVAQSIEKPGNLGTIIRSTDGTGADGLIICDRCTDLYNPNVITASTGMLFALPILETDSESCREYLRENNIKIVSATPHAEKNYTDVDLTGPIAIIVGTEQYGLTDDWMQEDENCINVRIPMQGQADSLNVATATTLLLYEALRQRSSK